MRTIYLGRDNTFDLMLTANGAPLNASAFNRWVLYMKDRKTGTVVTIDSAAAPTAFDVTTQVFYRDAKYTPLRCKLGLGSYGLVADHQYECWLRVYDATNTNGVVWPDQGDTVRIAVLSGP